MSLHVICILENAVLPNTKPSLNEDEVLTVPWMYIIIAVVVLFVVVALILALVYCQRKRYVCSVYSNKSNNEAM